jgi:radical SAM superfamily enzyme YgiQ (UPF0313 family)
MITSYKPDIICISTSFLSNTNHRHNILKQGSTIGYHWGKYENFEKILSICYYGKLFGSKVIVGGWEVTIDTLKTNDKKKYAYQYLKNYVDLFVIGDGCDIIQKIVINDKINTFTINGLTATAGTTLDFEDKASSGSKDDIILDDEALITELSSGCIFSCSFCNYSMLGKKKNEYVRSYDSLKTEIVNNHHNFNTRFYLMTDNIMNDYDEKMKMLIRIKQETGINLRWTGYARLDNIKDEKDALLIKESGAASLTFGIESMQKTVGPYIGKMTDKTRLLKKLNLCRDVFGDDVLITALFINGLPTETLESCDETFYFLNSDEGRHLIDYYSFSTLYIYKDNDTKNDINKKRNNPFRDYEMINNSDYWKSPWGEKKDFINKTLFYDSNKKCKSDYFGGFKLPAAHNAGIKIEDAIKMKRKLQKTPDNNLEKDIHEQLKTKTEQKIAEYKALVLSNV